MSGDCGHGWGYHSGGPSSPCDKCTEESKKQNPLTTLKALRTARSLVWGDYPHTKRVEISDAIDLAAAVLTFQQQRIEQLEEKLAGKKK